MKAMINPLRVRPRILVVTAFGLVAGALLPETLRAATRLLLAWNVTFWLYLTPVGILMRHPDHGHLRRQAAARAEGAGIVLMIAVTAATVSMVAIFAELGAVKGSGAGLASHNVALALATLVGSWLLLPCEFALSYASRHFAGGIAGAGLAWPLRAWTRTWKAPRCRTTPTSCTSR